MERLTENPNLTNTNMNIKANRLNDEELRTDELNEQMRELHKTTYKENFPGKDISIHIKKYDGHENIMTVCDTIKTNELLIKIGQMFHIPSESVHLIFQDKELVYDQNLRDQHIRDGATIHVLKEHANFDKSHPTSQSVQFRF